jgi:hypothetical protein
LGRLHFQQTGFVLKRGGQIGEFLRQVCDGFPSDFLLLHQAARKCINFFLDVELKTLKTPLEIIAQIRGFADQVLFELSEMAFMFASLCAEENVPNLVEVPACGSIVRVW